MSNRDPELLINDMLESVEKINLYTSDYNFSQFKDDSKTIDAVVRNLEIIGEAANKLPDNTKEKTDQIKWRRIVGLRNRIIHEYFGVDLKIIWRIITQDLPEFEDQLKNLQ